MNKFAKNILFLTVFITPLLFVVGLSENFEFIKLYFLTITLFISLMVILKSVKAVKISILDIALLMFLLLNIVNAVFSTNVYASVFGMFNVFSSSLLFLIAIILFLVFLKKYLDDINPDYFYKLILSSGIFVVIYGYFQVFKLDFILWEDYSRVFSTFGQPNFLSQFLGILLLISFYYFVEKQVRRMFIYTIFAVALLFLTQSLSTFIAISMVFLIYFFVRFKYFNKNYFAIFCLSVFLVFLICSPMYINRVYRQLNKGFDNGVYITNDTAYVRLLLYEKTFYDISKFEPKEFLIGKGEEDFINTFVRPAKIYTTSNWRTLFSKPHNFLLEEFYELGIFGFLFYLSILIVSLVYIRKSFIFLIPTFVLFNSFLFWPPNYLLFLTFLFFYIGLIKGQKIIYLYTINKYFKVLLMLFVSVCLFFSIYFLVSFIVFKKDPCLSLKMFNDNQIYLVECGNQRLTKIFVTSLLLRDKRASELAFNYQLDSYPESSRKIAKNLLAKEPLNPVYLFYMGRYYERVGVKDKALEYYLKASVGINDFYEAKDGVKRLKVGL